MQQFSEFLISQAAQNSKDYDAIFDNKYESYIKFHFEHLSQNSLNFLKHFVRHYILDKYFLQNYNYDEFELDNVNTARYEKQLKTARTAPPTGSSEEVSESQDSENDNSSISD